MLRHLPLEICQRLYAAGFPWETYFWWVKHRDEGLVWGQVERSDYQTKETEMLAPCPTLGELWDALPPVMKKEGPNGLYFLILSRLNENCSACYENGIRSEPDFGVGIGKTPEEAVANLWLALHAPK